MSRRFRPISFLFAVMFVVMPMEAVACACCAEPGEYLLSTAKPSTYSLEVLSDLEFTKSASLFTTEAGFEMINGLDPIRQEYESEWTADSSFDIAAAFTGKVWTFDFKTPKGRAAKFVLPMPTQMVTYKVDIHDEENRPNGPVLYKEFRFKGRLFSAGGFARPGFVRGTSFFLVFQGRGNGCDNASDFTHWRLEINGPRADYAFFGKLNTDAAKKRDIARSRWSAGMP